MLLHHISLAFTVCAYAPRIGHHFSEIMIQKSCPSHMEENEVSNILSGDNDEHIKSSCTKDW
jgi:hypothetical protein